jgi:hypothetical protein
MASFKTLFYSSMCLERLWKTTKNLISIIGIQQRFTVLCHQVTEKDRVILLRIANPVINADTSHFTACLTCKFLNYLRGAAWSTIAEISTGRTIYTRRCLRQCNQIFNWLLKWTRWATLYWVTWFLLWNSHRSTWFWRCCGEQGGKSNLSLI